MYTSWRGIVLKHKFWDLYTEKIWVSQPTNTPYFILLFKYIIFSHLPGLVPKPACQVAQSRAPAQGTRGEGPPPGRPGVRDPRRRGARGRPVAPGHLLAGLLAETPHRRGGRRQQRQGGRPVAAQGVRGTRRYGLGVGRRHRSGFCDGGEGWSICWG